MLKHKFYYTLGSLLGIGLLLACHTTAAPSPAGTTVQPTAILFLSWQPSLDKTYAEKLTARGFVATKANYMEPLAPDFLKQFNVFVLDEVPDISYAEKYPDKMTNYHNNLRVIKQAVAAGPDC